MKFGRTYQLQIQVDGKGTSVNVSYPLTLEFDVTRNTLASANAGHFRIFNLKEDTRKKIYHDRYQTRPEDYRGIILQAGYESEPKLPTIFRGNIIQANSYRSGTDWITEIEAFDGGSAILNGTTNKTYPSGYDMRQVLVGMVNGLHSYGVSPGAIGEVTTDQASRGLTISGNTWESINGMVPDGNAFVDGEKANILGRNEFIPTTGTNSFFEINSDTGLLNTPRRYDAVLEIPILFEPRIQVKNLIRLTSIETMFNGDYSVIGVKHRGVISGAVGGNATTVLSAWTGSGAFVPVGGQ